MTSLIFSYSHKDEDLRDRLETHLVMLKRQGVIDVWHDRRIGAGDEFDHAISDELEQADIILLLLSPDFLASEYCYDVEVKRAMERHESGAVRVIPVILRPCDWQSAPFGKLLAAPQDGRPVTKWPDLDEAFLDVAKAIRRVAEPAGKQASMHTQQQVAAPARSANPRSSNLRVKKEFAEVDRDRFMDESYEYMARFFENSLREPAAPLILAAWHEAPAKLLGSSLLKTKRDPADLEARLESFYGIWLAIAGRHGGVEMGASHAIGHVLGGSCGVPHGYTSCVMLPHVLRYNRAANAERHRLVAEALGHPGEDAADVLDNFIAELGLPRRLSDVGIGPDQYSTIATNAMHDRWLHANPVKTTSPEQVLKILEAAA